MIIDFAQIEATKLNHFYGGEQELSAKIFADDHNRIMLSCLRPGASIGYHQHDSGSEIIYILAGNGTIVEDEATQSITAGQGHYCPKGHSHSLINTGDMDLVFFAVVTQQ